jgi:hypothetical protein
MPRGGHREKAGRKSGWVNSETQLIRVPRVLAGRLLEIAKYLDQGNEIQFISTEFSGEAEESVHSDELIQQLYIFQLDDPLPQPLGLRALAKRLNVSSGTLSRYKKTTEKSLSWMCEKDGSWGWFYSPKTEKFHPIRPSDFDQLLYEESNEENYEDF